MFITMETGASGGGENGQLLVNEYNASTGTYSGTADISGTLYAQAMNYGNADIVFKINGTTVTPTWSRSVQYYHAYAALETPIQAGDTFEVSLNNIYGGAMAFAVIFKDS